jgi:thiamine biosynthesis lipoprotein
VNRAASIRTEVLMGTVVTIEVVPPGAERAIDRAFEWFRTIEAVCTRFTPDSELNRLIAAPGVATEVSPILFEAIQFALLVAEESGGAFDPTIGMHLHRRGFDRDYRTHRRITPSADADADAAGVSYRDVVVDAVRRTVTVRRPLVLDLGAVAKGLAVDTAVRELESFENYAIDAGGDLYLAGVNADGASWSVGIRHPRAAGEVIASVRVRDAALCTSGDYERRSDSGDDHHLVDPRTGRSAADLASVSVIAGSAMVADALATAAFVLGPGDGIALLDRLGVDGLFVTPDLQCTRTSGWPRD